MINVVYQETNWRARGNAFEYSGNDANKIGFLTLGHMTRLSGLTAIQITLQIFLTEFHPWWTTVYNTRITHTMTFATGGNGK